MRIITLLAVGLYPAIGFAQAYFDCDYKFVRIITLDSVAVFNALATTTTRKASGEQLARTQRFTDVLVRREGRWQLIAGHSSRVP